MKDPSTAEEWLDVARERGEDASALLDRRNASIGPTYLAGYTIESALKAYLQAQGKPRPSSGSGGHNIRNLWKSGGLQFRDLRDPNGSISYFVDSWTTDLRYQVSAPLNTPDSDAAVTAAKRTLGYVTALIKRRR